MKNLLLLFILFTLTTSTFGQKAEDLKISHWIEGTLLTPDNPKDNTLAIIIGGSGPTDRDGNQMMIKNNSLKYLATELSKAGIFTFRYDKRIVQQLKQKVNIDERTIKFDDFINDAVDVITFFKSSDRFKKIYIIGHSQGSLVGMVAAQNDVDGFISIAGAGQSIDGVIVDQLGEQAPGLMDNARNAFDEMRVNGSTKNFSPGVSSIFRPDLQPFMLTWMKYDPQVEITKLDMPVLIVNGDKDLQVNVSEAEKLQSAKADAAYHIIKDMNHILKDIKGDDLENQKSYNEPGKKISEELVQIISKFIL